jgi:hypothetical protein
MERVRAGSGGYLAKIIKAAREKKFGTPVVSPTKTNSTSGDAAQAGLVGVGAPRQRTAMSMDDYLNYAMRPQRAFYEPVPADASPAPPDAGHVSIPTDPGRLQATDTSLAGLRERLAKLGLNFHFEEGGKVEVKASKLKDIQGAISRLQSKQIAQALDAIRAEKAQMEPPPQSLAEGGEVEAQPQDAQQQGAPPQGDLAENGDPTQLYAEYQSLVAELDNPDRDEDDHMMIVERLEQIQSALEALGIETPEVAT